MHIRRIIDLGEDLREHVFEVLDSEPEMTGMDAGKVAAAVEKAFVEALQLIYLSRNNSEIQPTAESLYELFNQVNQDVVENGGEAILFCETEYYAEQILNIYGSVGREIAADLAHRLHQLDFAAWVAANDPRPN